MLSLRTLLFCGAALLGTCASAQEAPAPTRAASHTQEAGPTKGELKAMRDFKMLDFNNDGKLSRTEVKLFPRLSAAFDDADTDHDNYVSYEEVREFAVKYRAERDRQKAARAESTHNGTVPPSPAATNKAE